MAEMDSNKDELESSIFYRMRRDTMMIVATLNNGHSRPSGEDLKKQIALIQSQLFLAAVADPQLPQQVKNDLIKFHNATVKDLLSDKRGSRQRTKSAHIPATLTN